MIRGDAGNGPPVIEAGDLHYTYPGSGRPALNGLTVAVAGGEIFGLLGPNGAGKTTALSILSTVFRPNKGRFSVCGTDALLRPASVRKNIGFIPQEPALYPALTLRENLVYFGRLYDLRARELEQRVSECLDLVGLAGHADARVGHLSGGMKRRGNIAVGLINNPRVLLLDEPTVGVDIHTRKLIFDNLIRLRDAGMAMIYTTHYMEDAEQLCDRIMIMDHGRHIAGGRPAELVEQAQGCRNLEDLFLRLTGRRIRE